MRDRPIGVLGAGVMGAGVAQSLAEAGHEVALVDVDRGALERALAEIRNQLRFRGLLGGGDPVPDPEAVVARIRRSVDISDLAEAAFVIENVTESWEVKERALGAIDAGVRLQARFVPTDRNRMMYATYKFAGFAEIEDAGDHVLLENDFTRIQSCPDYVTLEVEDR